MSQRTASKSGKGAKAKSKDKSKSRDKVEAANAPPAPEPARGSPEPRPQPATAEAPSTEPRPETATPRQEPPRPEGAPAIDLSMLPPEQRAIVEKLSLNLARAAVTAQGAIAEAALRQADRPAALSPDPFHVGPALNEVVGRLAGEPDKLMRAQADLFSRYMELWQAAARRASGEKVDPVATPQRGDRRFTDPEWTDNPVFDVIKQSYLLTSNWLNKLVSDVEGIDPLAKRRVEFFMQMLTDAFSPSNFLMSNPAALREVIATHGESLVRGMENFAADLARGGGQLAISQTDYEQFKIGENVATAPGKVVYRNELIELIQYAPSTEKVHEIPLVIFPPWINKFYVLDLRPDNSMIRWLTGQGFTVFLASWVNPDAQLATKTFEDYMVEGIYAGTSAAMKQAGVSRVNAVGYCIGGTLLASTLAHMAAMGDDRIASATFFAAQQDFAEAGDLLLFANEAWIRELEEKMDAAGGVLSGQSMADTFNVLRSNDLIWSFFVNNYLLGKEPKPFDLLFWNSDQTRMPKTLHLYYLRQFYGRNALSKGELQLGGLKLDMAAVKTPVFIQSSRDDHIAPARSVYRGARLFGGPVTYMMAGSGHIAGVINPPHANKYQYWVNEALPETLEAWRAEAREVAGSWWPYWADWLRARSGPLVPARDPAKGPLPVICDAPGAYVQVKS